MNDNDVIDDDLLDLALKEIEKEERDLIARLPLVARKIIADKESDVAAAKRREKQAVVQAKASAFDKLHLINVSAEVSLLGYIAYSKCDQITARQLAIYG
ncbi:MAG: hypothetical protein NTX38_09890 [Methylobacter sp.]|nr:hypothetical protein [Methylobacter sp.]